MIDVRLEDAESRRGEVGLPSKDPSHGHGIYQHYYCLPDHDSTFYT